MLDTRTPPLYCSRHTNPGGEGGAMRRFWRSKMGIAVTAVAAIAAAGGAAWATIPDSGGVIHACFDSKSGNLRVLDAPSHSCTKFETSIDWNRQGLAGAPGS